jgi:hypothetical protein
VSKEAKVKKEGKCRVKRTSKQTVPTKGELSHSLHTLPHLPHLPAPYYSIAIRDWFDDNSNIIINK